MISTDYLLNLIKEDAPAGDVTSETIIPDICCNAVIRSEEIGIVAGLHEASVLFSHFGVSVVLHFQDGSPIRRGDILVSLSGDAKKILLVERTALNIIGRMGGIATQTRELVDRVRAVNQKCQIAGTRKTSPDCRMLDKKALVLGGGEPHRGGLSDGILIKDNHLALIPLVDALRAARQASAYGMIEIEVETPSDALLAARNGADIIMLDNMPPDLIRQAVQLICDSGLRDRILIEISGGINSANIETYAALDVDRISLGLLTHTVKNFSATLEIIT